MRYARAGGDGPIASILRLLERKGIMILAATLPDYVFGMSTWADKKHPLMILDFNPEKSTVEKLRFTAVHELAHLLLLFPPFIYRLSGGIFSKYLLLGEECWR